MGWVAEQIIRGGLKPALLPVIYGDGRGAGAHVMGFDVLLLVSFIRLVGFQETGLGTEMKGVAILCGLLSLLLATTLSYAAILLVLCIIAVSATYSIPPLRLKKYPIISIFVISIGALLAFALGFYSGSTQNAFPINMAYGILVCFTLAFNTKDLKDYEGDKENEIWTIPVIFGLKRGRIIIAFLDLLAYLVVPFILGINNLILPAIVFGVATFLVVLRKESKEWQIFLLYFLFLIAVFIMN